MECPECLCAPCIITRGYVRMGEGQRPSEKNPGVRKSYYRKFWGCLANLGVWRHPTYLRKKRNCGQLNVITKREIMPKCVIEHVRALHPNPKGLSYMGHKWE